MICRLNTHPVFRLAQCVEMTLNLWAGSRAERKGVENMDTIINKEKSFGEFTQIPNFVLGNRLISLGARMLYINLLSFDMRGKSQAFPGQEWLAFRLGFENTRQVRKLLEELKSWGLVSWYQRKGKLGQTISNMYIIEKFPRGLRLLYQDIEIYYKTLKDLPKEEQGKFKTKVFNGWINKGWLPKSWLAWREKMEQEKEKKRNRIKPIM